MQQEVVPMVKCTHTWAAVHGWRPCGEATKTTSPLAQVPNWHLACKLVWQSWGDGMGICSKWATNCLSFKGALYGWQRPHATKNVFGCLQRNISWLMTSDKTLLSKRSWIFLWFHKTTYGLVLPPHTPATDQMGVVLHMLRHVQKPMELSNHMALPFGFDTASQCFIHFLGQSAVVHSTKISLSQQFHNFSHLQECFALKHCNASW